MDLPSSKTWTMSYYGLDTLCQRYNGSLFREEGYIVLSVVGSAEKTYNVDCCMYQHPGLSTSRCWHPVHYVINTALVFKFTPQCANSITTPSCSQGAQSPSITVTPLYYRLAMIGRLTYIYSISTHVCCKFFRYGRAAHVNSACVIHVCSSR